MAKIPIELVKLIKKEIKEVIYVLEPYYNIYNATYNKKLESIVNLDDILLKVVKDAASSKTLSSMLKKIAVSDDYGDYYKNVVNLCVLVQYIQTYKFKYNGKLIYEELLLE